MTILPDHLVDEGELRVEHGKNRYFARATFAADPVHTNGSFALTADLTGSLRPRPSPSLPRPGRVELPPHPGRKRRPHRVPRERRTVQRQIGADAICRSPLLPSTSAAIPPGAARPPHRTRCRVKAAAAIQVGDGPLPCRIGPVTATDIVRLTGVGGDFNPLHHDEAAARAAGFDAIITMGQLSAGRLATLLTDRVSIENLRGFEVRFVAPVRVGTR